jgi:hypothetical protein
MYDLGIEKLRTIMNRAIRSPSWLEILTVVKRPVRGMMNPPCPLRVLLRCEVSAWIRYCLRKQTRRNRNSSAKVIKIGIAKTKPWYKLRCVPERPEQHPLLSPMDLIFFVGSSQVCVRRELYTLSFL